MKAVCFTGASGSGKTTLLRRLIRLLVRRGYRVGVLKHAHHGFDMDKKGKDSYHFFSAGARVTCVAGPDRMAIFFRTARTVRPRELLPYFRGCDLLLIEGYRGEPYPKVEVFRRAVEPTPLFLQKRYRIAALVTRDPVDYPGPVFSPSNLPGIARFVLALARAGKAEGG